MEKRWTAQATNPNRASDLDGKSFQGKKSPTDKSFATSESGLQKTFSAKTFTTTPFADKKDAETLQRTFSTRPASQQETQFTTQAANSQNKHFTTTPYSDEAKKLAAADRQVDSRKFTPEAKDPKHWAFFRDKLNKDLTMEEIRELLNKPPSN